MDKFIEIDPRHLIEVGPQEWDNEEWRYPWDFLEEIGFGCVNHPEWVRCVGRADVNGKSVNVYRYRNQYHAALNE